MKHTCIAILAVLAAASKVSAVRMGPKNCVSLTKSTEGSCVLSTNCDGLDLSAFEFAFDCKAPDGVVQRHSFGFGGFDAQEEFDTSVKCSTCSEPQQTQPQTQAAFHDSVVTNSVEHPVVAAVGVSEEEKEKDKKKKDKDDKEEEEEKDKKKKKKEDEKDEKEGKGEDEEGKVDLKPPEDASEIVKYGPNSCIWTWKNETTGHCIMKTQCEGQDISKYMFGLMCDSKDEGMVRHLFGEGSFADDESFDTLIPCDKCLALDAPPDVELSAEVKSLKEEVEEIKEGVKELDAKVSHTKGEFKEEEKEEEKEEKEKEKKKDDDEEEEDDKKKKKDDDDDEKADDDKKKKDKDSSFLIHSADAVSDVDDVDAQVFKGSFRKHHRAHKRHHRHKRVRHDDDDDDDAETDSEDEAPKSKRHSLAHHRSRAKKADDSDDQSRDEENDHAHNNDSEADNED